MFGKLSLTYRDKQLSCENNRSRQSWSILSHLIYNHGKVVPSEDLTALVLNSEKSDNPTGAMRTAIHRVRTLLENLIPDIGRGLLIHQNGGYMWNPDAAICLDVDEFEKQAAHFLNESEITDIDSLISTLQLYEGDFLSTLSSETWVMPLQMYYHGIYEQLIEKAMPCLEKSERIVEAVDILQKALQTDRYSEPLYQYLMRFLLRLGKRQEVIAVYEKMSKLLLSTFGVMPDRESRSLYREALRTDQSRAIPSALMMEDLNETSEIKTALICDYDFFRMMYQSQARMIVRTGTVIHVALISLKPKTSKEVSQKSLETVMDNLEMHLGASLRKGDIITRCSASQFLIMLPQANYENSCKVCERFIASFQRKYPHAVLGIEFCVNPITPATNS